MRIRIVAFAALALVGCAHPPPGELAGVEVRLGSCIPAASPNVSLAVRNGSSARVSFRTYGSSGPPYKLHPGGLQLLSIPSNDPWQVVLEHFVPPSHEVTLAPGDEATFTVEPSVWPSLGEAGGFRVEVRDTLGRAHHSAALDVCHPGSSA
jgi:hypothetical protein